ncbi:MAG: hypothetical protein ACK4QP_18300 [Pseudorhizobium sp.]
MKKIRVVSIGLEKLNRLKWLELDLQFLHAVEPTAPQDVLVGLSDGEIMMMQPQTPAPQPKQQPIPQHVIDRLESEWRQMRESAAPQPRLAAAE